MITTFPGIHQTTHDYNYGSYHNLLSAYYMTGGGVIVFGLDVGHKQQIGNLWLLEAYALFLIDLARKEIFQYCLAQLPSGLLAKSIWEQSLLELTP